MPRTTTKSRGRKKNTHKKLLKKFNNFLQVKPDEANLKQAKILCEEVLKQVDQNINLNIYLKHAIIHGYYDVAMNLISSDRVGIVPDEPRINLNTHLKYVIIKGQNDIALALIRSGKVDLNYIDSDDFSFLMYFVESFREILNPNIEAIEILLDYVDVNQLNIKGQTALMHAVSLFNPRNNNNINLIEYLITKGTNINLKDLSGSRAQDYNIHNYQEIVDFFQKYEKSINIQTDLEDKKHQPTLRVKFTEDALKLMIQELNHDLANKEAVMPLINRLSSIIEKYSKECDDAMNDEMFRKSRSQFIYDTKLILMDFLSLEITIDNKELNFLKNFLQLIKSISKPAYQKNLQDFLDIAITKCHMEVVKYLLIENPNLNLIQSLKKSLSENRIINNDQFKFMTDILVSIKLSDKDNYIKSFEEILETTILYNNFAIQDFLTKEGIRVNAYKIVSLLLSSDVDLTEVQKGFIENSLLKIKELDKNYLGAFQEYHYLAVKHNRSDIADFLKDIIPAEHISNNSETKLELLDPKPSSIVENPTVEINRRGIRYRYSVQIAGGRNDSLEIL